jgi:hypothetical protein
VQADRLSRDSSQRADGALERQSHRKRSGATHFPEIDCTAEILKTTTEILTYSSGCPKRRCNWMRVLKLDPFRLKWGFGPAGPPLELYGVGYRSGQSLRGASRSQQL